MRRISSFFLFSLALPALLLVPGFSGPAEARPEMAAQNAGDRFEAIDTDKNGSICRKEFCTAFPQMKDAAFDAIDSDKDGAISREEWEAFFDSHGKDAAAVHPADADGAKAGEAKGGESKTGEADKKPAKAPELIMPPKGGN